MAEREGFEPSVQVTPDNCLAGSPDRPLQHLSTVLPRRDILRFQVEGVKAPEYIHNLGNRQLADEPIPAMLCGATEPTRLRAELTLSDGKERPLR